MAGIRNQSIFRRTFASISGSMSWARSPTRLIAKSLSVDVASKAVSASWPGDDAVAFSSERMVAMLEAVSRTNSRDQEQEMRNRERNEVDDSTSLDSTRTAWISTGCHINTSATSAQHAKPLQAASEADGQSRTLGTPSAHNCDWRVLNMPRELAEVGMNCAG